MQEEIKNKLVDFPPFRERKFRAQFLTILALRSLELENRVKNKENLSSEQLTAFAVAWSSYERAWRQVLLNNPELRGEDWEERTTLEKKKQKELGYNVISPVMTVDEVAQFTGRYDND
jgi:hypothetical protein